MRLRLSRQFGIDVSIAKHSQRKKTAGKNIKYKGLIFV